MWYLTFTLISLGVTPMVNEHRPVVQVFQHDSAEQCSIAGQVHSKAYDKIPGVRLVWSCTRK